MDIKEDFDKACENPSLASIKDEVERIQYSIKKQSGGVILSRAEYKGYDLSHEFDPMDLVSSVKSCLE